MEMEISMKRTEKQVFDLYVEFKRYQSALSAYLTRVKDAIGRYEGEVAELQDFVNGEVDDKDFSVRLVDLTRLMEAWRFVVECRKTSEYKRAHDYNPRNLLHTFVFPEEDGNVDIQRTCADISYYNAKTAEELERLKDAYENYGKYEKLVRKAVGAVTEYHENMNVAVCPTMGFV